MRTKRIIKRIVDVILTASCIVCFGCSREYIERSDALLQEYRKNEISPNYQRIISAKNEYWWRNEWRTLPVIGAPRISINPALINIPAPIVK